MFRILRKSEIFLIVLILIASLNISFINCSLSANSSNDFPLQPNDPAIEKAVNFLKNQQSEDGGIGGVSVSAWSAMAISSVEEDPSAWGDLVKYLKEKSSVLDPDKATDWERHLLAVVSCNENPRDFAGINFIEKIKDFFDGTQMDDSADMFDDFFGILSLISAGVKKDDSLIQDLKSYIVENQESNGGWGDADATSAAIMALISAGERSSSEVITDALSFLKTLQTDSGGFHSWGKTNLASTSWSIMAIVASGEDPTSSSWQTVGKNPVEYVLSLQQGDGSFHWAANQSRNPLWMTSYAIPALVGCFYPIKINETTVEENNPPGPPDKPTGPSSGCVGATYTFSTRAIDTENDKIKYRFDWDSDGNPDYSSWTTMYKSGETVSINHVFDKQGVYFIEAQAMDEHGMKSSWSNSLKITIKEDSTEPEKNDKKPAVEIIKPENNSLYFANLKIKNIPKNTLIIGAINIKVNTTDDVKKVEFYVNDKLEHTDENHPFEYRLNKRTFFQKKVVSVKSYVHTNITSNISKMIEEIMQLLCNNEINTIQDILLEFLDEYKGREFSFKDVDSKEIIILNAFPNLHLR